MSIVLGSCAFFTVKQPVCLFVQPCYMGTPRKCSIQITAMASSVVRRELLMRKSLFWLWQPPGLFVVQEMQSLWNSILGEYSILVIPSCLNAKYTKQIIYMSDANDLLYVWVFNLNTYFAGGNLSCSISTFWNAPTQLYSSNYSVPQPRYFTINICNWLYMFYCLDTFQWICITRADAFNVEKKQQSRKPLNEVYKVYHSALYTQFCFFEYSSLLNFEWLSDAQKK